MARATWNGTVLAESDDTIVVEGNHYFPPSAIDPSLVRPSSTHTTCSWKGVASYYTIEVDGQRNVDAAWFYPEPKAEAENITGYVAFWKGISIEA